MTETRFPPNVALTTDDFATFGWREALATQRGEGYSSMWQALSAAAQVAVDAERAVVGKALWLMADACSMMLVTGRNNDPFRPTFVGPNGRSAIPADFQPEHLEFFAAVVGEVDDPRLKARLADLVWLMKRPRDPRFALEAIDAYRAIPLDAETWLQGGKECWQRAVALARMLGAGASTRLAEMEAALEGAFDAATPEENFWPLSVGEFLLSAGLARSRTLDIAEKLRSIGELRATNGDLHAAREYFEASSRAFESCDDADRSVDMKVALAEAWATEANARTSSSEPSFMAAASFYEHALQIYRSIPRRHREQLNVDQRIAELHADLARAGQRSLDEMGVIRSPTIDITDMVEAARASVSGKEAIEALRAVAGLWPGPRVQRLRENALSMLQRFSLQAIIPRTTLSRDGRVIAKRPGMSFAGTPTEGDEIVLRAQMIQDLGMSVGLFVQGEVMPALNILALEHRFTLDDFIALAKGSPIIPPGRERLVGRGLYEGYEGDFSTALHLLVPQVEHMVRFHLKQAGVKTTHIDIDGIENEIGLSSLMALPQADAVFGADLAFEIRAVFCDAFGPNLRNELSHGLLDDESSASIHAAYAWWMMLRLTFAGWWNSQRRAEKTGEDSGGDLSSEEGGAAAEATDIAAEPAQVESSVSENAARE